MASGRSSSGGSWAKVGPVSKLPTGQTCERCVLGTTDRCAIVFDRDGVCNYCRDFERRWAQLPHSDAERKRLRDAAVDRIKKAGKGRPYDCIIGLSGGVDSSYLAYLSHELGLRPLAVHFDNGWNSETAAQNVEKIVNTLRFDLYTFVINWEEFREMQLAYLRASVIDIEVLTDHAIYGTLYKLAIERRIPFILSGANEATEGILPREWVFPKQDYINIKSIYRAFGRGSLTTYPFLNRRMKRTIRRSGIEIVTFLDIVDYQSADAKTTIEGQLGWRDYGGKHYESVWTRFYQGYILPRKFGIDKRKAHLSTLINSGQITKDEALRKLAEPIYTDSLFSKDYPFVLKKLELTEVEFENIMKLPVRSHYDFDIEGSLFHYFPLLKSLRPAWDHFKRRTGLDRRRLQAIIRS